MGMLLISQFISSLDPIPILSILVSPPIVETELAQVRKSGLGQFFHGMPWQPHDDNPGPGACPLRQRRTWHSHAPPHCGDSARAERPHGPGRCTWTPEKHHGNSYLSINHLVKLLYSYLYINKLDMVQFAFLLYIQQT